MSFRRKLCVRALPAAVALAFGLSVNAADNASGGKIKQSLLQVEPPRTALLNEIIELLPKAGHFVQIEAQNRCSSYRFLRESSSGLECQLTSPGDHRIAVTICDEAKTSCRQEEFLVSIPARSSGARKPARATAPANLNRQKRVAAPPGFSADLARAFAEAKKKKHFLLVDYSSDHCTPCEDLKEKVFAKPSFQNATKSLVKAYADSAVDQTHELLAAYELFWTPTVLVLQPNGAELGRFVGYVPEQELLTKIEQMLGSKHEPIQQAVERFRQGTKQKLNPNQDAAFAALSERVGIWFSLTRNAKEAILALEPLEKKSLAAREAFVSSRLSVAEEKRDHKQIVSLLGEIFRDKDLRARAIGWARFYARYVLKPDNPKLAEQVADDLLENIESLLKEYNPQSSFYSRDALISMEGDAHELLQNRAETKSALERELGEVEKLIDAASSEPAKIELEFKRVSLLRRMGKEYRAKRSLVDLLDRGEGQFDVLVQAYLQYMELDEPKVAAELVTKMENTARTADERAQAEMYRVKALLVERKTAEAARMLDEFFSSVSLPRAASAWSHYRVKQARRLAAEVRAAQETKSDTNKN